MAVHIWRYQRAVVAAKRILGIHKPLGVVQFLKRHATRRAERAAVTPELEAELKAWFAPDVERLSGLLDRDLRGWTR